MVKKCGVDSEQNESEWTGKVENWDQNQNRIIMIYGIRKFAVDPEVLQPTTVFNVVTVTQTNLWFKDLCFELV